MSYNEMIHTIYSEPAVILHISGGTSEIADVNERLLDEIGINTSPQEFISKRMFDFDEVNRLRLQNALEKSIETGERVECEASFTLVSECCGREEVFVRCAFSVIEKQPEYYVIYCATRNISAEIRRFAELSENERIFKHASEQVNIYYWEYTVATKEMRPCFRCMRDLGLPALVKNYPEPAIENGIFPPDYADMYRDWHRQIEAGVPELEAVIPLTVARVPFRVKYTTEYDSEGRPYKAYGSATLVSEKEIRRSRLDSSIIETLACIYNNIYLIDLEKDKIETIKHSEGEENIDDLSYTYIAPMMFDRFVNNRGNLFERLSQVSELKESLFDYTDNMELNLKLKSSGGWGRLTYQVVERSTSPEQEEQSESSTASEENESAERGTSQDASQGVSQNTSQGVNQNEDRGKESARNPVTKILIMYTDLDYYKSKKLEGDLLIAQQKIELERRQEQLVLAVEEANRANRAKSDFLARMSHEIRTPMNAIMGLNEIITRMSTESTVKEYASDAYKAATGLLGTINDILDFSKIESGKMELVEDNFSLGEFLANLYNMFAMRAEGKQLAFVFNVDENLPGFAYGDELRLRQILTNILSNAVKYTDEGSVELNAFCVSRDEESATVRFTVKDTGRGIREEDIHRLYEAFERIDEKSSRNIEGTGLGMNITLRLLEMMGSKLEVQSTYKEGSEFSFVLRLGVKEYEKMGNFQNYFSQLAQVESNVQFTMPKGTVLVVDDNAVNLKVISAMLKETQMKTVVVTSGEVALRAASQRKFDIIFMDHYMPEMDGIETLERLRSNPQGLNYSTPVVALTANAIKGADEKYLASGFVDVVYKPTTQKELNEVLFRVLKG